MKKDYENTTYSNGGDSRVGKMQIVGNGVQKRRNGGCHVSYRGCKESVIYSTTH